MKSSTTFLIQASNATTKEVKDLVSAAGGTPLDITAPTQRYPAGPRHADVVAVVDEAAFAKLKATQALKVRRVEWLGSMADPEGKPNDQSLYPGHMPLTQRQVATLRKEGTQLYRVGGISEAEIKKVADQFKSGASVEVVKVAGQLHNDQPELTIKANDQGILGLLAKNGTQVSVC
jgi:hypothetical protein